MTISAIVQDQNPWWREPATRPARNRPVRRTLQREVLSQILRIDDRRAVLVMGPRQVGKTTLLLQIVDDLLEGEWPPANITYFDFSDHRLVGEISPREVLESVPAGSSPDRPRVLLLDEISRARRWDLWLKQAVDHGIGRIAATDSAASVLRQGSRESGQGRWDELWMEGLDFREFVALRSDPGEDFEAAHARAPNLLDLYLDLGGFPEYASSDRPAEVRRRLRSDVVERAILRDLAGRVEDPNRVRDLFVYLVQESGGLLNVQNRARDLDADHRSVVSWLALLEDTLLISPLQLFTPRAAARLRSQPKIYAVDHGLIPAFAASPEPGRDADIRSRVFEAVVYRHLRDAVRELEAQIGYWRDRKGSEIDFVLRGRDGRTTVAIEVTSGWRPRSDKLAQTARGAEQLGATSAILVHGGLEEGAVGGVRVVPLGRFLADPVRSVTEER
jgi:predicted AAA+ superfamily ATPase